MVLHPKYPHLRKTETSSQLYVHGKPFLMLAAELQNSSMTSAAFMDTVWQKLVDMNINTVLGCVTWEMIEPQEDQFDFEELHKVILGARSHGLRLVLLWFGSFKNGISTYTPSWVKTDPKRFPRAKLRKAGGILQTGDVLSIFHPSAPAADAKAFAKLMTWLRSVDESHSTVLMVQVENEPGLLGDSRDGSPAADHLFNSPVPSDLIHLLTTDPSTLHADLKALNLTTFTPTATPNTWSSVFGTGPRTDELFMAYHYARYLQSVAAAGHAAYPLPLYTNVWQNYTDTAHTSSDPSLVAGGAAPGTYPSGGATSNTLDIWQAFAPALSFISPDIYLNDYASSCAAYRHRDQPLFVPEQRRDAYGARRAWIALGSYAALGVAPFGIDTLPADDTAYRDTYALLSRVRRIVLDAQARNDTSVGFVFDEISSSGEDPSAPVVRQWDAFELTISRSFVFGQPGPGAGMVIRVSSDAREGARRATFLLIGSGFQVAARAVSACSTFTGILRFEEKEVVDAEAGTLRTIRRLNGDETRSGIYAIMPGPDPDYGGFPISVTIPANTMIAELEMYSLEDE